MHTQIFLSIVYLCKWKTLQIFFLDKWIFLIYKESVSWQNKSVILSPMFSFLPPPLQYLISLWHLTMETKLALPCSHIYYWLHITLTSNSIPQVASNKPALQPMLKFYWTLVTTDWRFLLQYLHMTTRDSTSNLTFDGSRSQASAEITGQTWQMVNIQNICSHLH